MLFYTQEHNSLNLTKPFCVLFFLEKTPKIQQTLSFKKLEKKLEVWSRTIPNNKNHLLVAYTWSWHRSPMFVCKLWSQAALSVAHRRGKLMIGREHLISSQVKQSSHSLSSASSSRSVSWTLHTDVNTSSKQGQQWAHSGVCMHLTYFVFKRVFKRFQAFLLF